MFVYLFLSFVPSWMQGMTDHIIAEVIRAGQHSLIKAAWQRAAAFSGEYRTISQLPANRLNHSTVRFDQASLPKHLDGASDKRCSEKKLAACPAAAEEFERAEGTGGMGDALFPVDGEM